MANPETPDRRFVVELPDGEHDELSDPFIRTWKEAVAQAQLEQSVADNKDSKAQIYELVPVPEEK